MNPSFAGKDNGSNHEIHSALKTSEEIPWCKSLLDFLKEMAENNHLEEKWNNFLKSDKTFNKFASNIILAFDNNYNVQELKDISFREKRRSSEQLDELIKKCIQSLLESSKDSDRKKLQCFGYQLTRHRGETTMKALNLSTQKQYFLRKEWNDVRLMIGDELFCHIYKNYLIFERTREGSLVQFAGKNIFGFLEVAKDQATVDPEELKISKCCKYNIKDNNDHYPNNINEEIWNSMKSRTRIFYCTQYNRQTQFFKKHLLMKDADALSPEDRAEKLFQDILRFNRIRKQLKTNITNILAHMVKKIKKFRFCYYLSKSCPLPENWIERKKVILSHLNDDKLKKAKYYEELFSYTIDNKCVTQFLNEFFYHTLPKDFMTGKNKKSFQKKIKRYVGLNKNEIIPKNLLVGKLDISSIKWLEFKTSKKNYHYFDKENRFVLWFFLKWIFEDVVVSLIRCFFYVTEQQKSYSETYYYRKNIWDIVMKYSIADLNRETLEEVSKEDMVKWKNELRFAPGKLRLIPKKTTFRPIMTFNKKIVDPDGKASKMTTTTKLFYSHLMLKTLKNRMFKDPFGFAVFNYDDVMRKYEEFVLKWRQVGRPKLYFVTMDIEKCYDSVDREKLSQFLGTTQLLSSEFRIMTIQSMKKNNAEVVDQEKCERKKMKDCFRQKWHKIALESNQSPSLLDVLENDQNELNAKKTLLVENQKRDPYKKKALLDPVIEICRHNYIEFNRKYYKQTKGIPQGLCVSSILSSFYYASLEEHALGYLRKESMDTINPNITLLMRLTDDYLLVTTKKSNAVLFIEKLTEVSSLNKFKFNMKKLQTNFPLDPSKLAKYGITSVEDQNIAHKYIDWIGISIDMTTMALTPNMNLRRKGILCTLNMNMQTKKASMWLKRKLKAFLMNNITHYFRKTITNREFSNKTLNKLYIAGAYKYMQCCIEYKDHFRTNTEIHPQLDKIICAIIYSVTRAFFKYLVCNIKDSIYDREHSRDFSIATLRHFIEIFSLKKNHFSGVVKILVAKEQKMLGEKDNACMTAIEN
uniref:Telomerase reverse transcriptase n=1 Tax=Euplotes crassus TaxID=5936 RepID=Q7Z1L0_EUPCR|nr:telomerase reverse transcriptase [Moneuplotes crassus]